MQASESKREPLGQMLGALILSGIVLFIFIIIFLDKKWHSKVQTNSIPGICDLPPLFSSQTMQRNDPDRQLRTRNIHHGLSHQNQPSLQANQSFGLGFPATSSRNSNWILSRRLDFSNSRNVELADS